MPERGRKSRRESKGDWRRWGGDGGRAGVCGMPPSASGPLTGFGLALHSGLGDRHAEKLGRHHTIPIVPPEASFCPCFSSCSNFSCPFSSPHCAFPIPPLSSSTHRFPIFWNGYIYCPRRRVAFLVPLAKHINRHGDIGVSGAASLWQLPFLFDPSWLGHPKPLPGVRCGNLPEGPFP